MSAKRAVTVDGIETVFAVNHLAYYLLTQLLLPRLVESAPARIVNVASDAHHWDTLDFDDLQNTRRYRPLKVYGQSKLCNILFTRELARRIEGTEVTVNSLSRLTFAMVAEDPTPSGQGGPARVRLAVQPNQSPEDQPMVKHTPELSAPEVLRHTQALLEEHLPLNVEGDKCTTDDVFKVLVGGGGHEGHLSGGLCRLGRDHGKRASSTGKPKELGEIGDLPARPLAFDFQ